MTIVANKHVARVGHEFAAAMTADTPIIEIAKMVSRLATALDKQTELTEQLAMENTILLTPENWLKHSEEGAAASAIAEGNGAVGWNEVNHSLHAIPRHIHSNRSPTGRGRRGGI